MKEAINKKIYIKRVFGESEFLKSNNINNALMFANTRAELVAPIDRTTGKVKTGLEGWSKEELADFEYDLQLNPGDLRSSDFWADFKIVVPPNGKWLDLNTPKGRLEYIVLCQIKTVAKGMEELEKIKTAANLQNSAVFVMRNAEDEAVGKVSKANVKRKAYDRAGKLGPEDMSNFLVYMGQTPQNMSRDIIESKVYEEVDLNPARFLQVLDSPTFKDVVFINKLLFHNILSQRGQAIYHGGQVMTNSLESAIAHINLPANQPLKLALMSDLDVKEGKTDVVETFEIETKVKKAK